MGDVTSKRVNIYIDHSAAETSLERLQVSADRLSKKIAEGTSEGKNMNKELKQLENVKKNIDEITNRIEQGFKPTIKEQTTLVSHLRNELRGLSESDPKFAEKLQNYQKQNTTLHTMKASINGVAKAQTSWLKQAGAIGAGVVIGNTIQAAIAAIGNYVSGIVTGNASLSDSLAKVRQTTGLTDAAVQSLSSSLRKIDTRTANAELLKIAEIGGQFNVPTEQLKGFVEQIDKVNVVLGSEFGGGAEQITTEMSLLRNVFSDIKSDNIAQDIGFISNAVVTLAQEGAATAPIVSDFAKRLSPLEATAKLTSGAVLGLSATLQELAVNPERGGTAVVKLFDKMISNADAFAKVAGVGASEFKKLLQQDSFAAFQKVLEGFKKGGDNVTALNTVVNELEVSGVGAKEVLVKLSENIPLLTNRSNLATEALTKQDKITEQFAISNQTLGAQLDKLGKAFSSFVTNSTFTKILTNMVSGLTEVFEKSKSLTQQFDEQNIKVNNLEKSITPLLGRYDELKSKTSLNKDEQTELKKIINEVTTALPGAASAFDAYGNVIAINTDRVRLYIDAERARLKVVNQGAIKENQDTLTQLTNQIANTQLKIAQIQKTGSFLIDVPKSAANSGPFLENGGKRKASQQEIADQEALYKSLLEQRTGYLAEIKRLNGDSLQEQVNDATKAADEQKKLNDTPIAPTDKQVSAAAKEASKAKKNLEELQKAWESFLASIMGKNQTPLSEEAKALQEFDTDLQSLLSSKIKLKAAGIFNQAEYDKAFEKINGDYKDKIAKINAEKQSIQVPVEIIPNAPEEDDATAMANAIDSQKNILEKLKIPFKDFLKGLFDKDSILETGKALLGAAQTALGIIDKFNQAKNARESRSLDRELKANDIRKKSNESLASNKTITQQELARRNAQIDAESDRKKEDLERKQFERNKRQQIAQAGISGAQALLTSVAKFGPPIPPNFEAIIAFAFTLATNLAEIAAIKSAKYAQGGKLSGPSHDQGGMPVISNGKKVAEMEGGEGILKKSAMASRQRYTVTGTASEIASTLNAAHGGVQWDNEAAIQPAYRNRPYYAVDYGRINSTYSYLRYAEGGKFNTGSQNTTNTAQAQDNSEIMNMLQLMQMHLAQNANTIKVLNEILAAGISANVSLKKFDDARALDERRKKDGEFK